MTNQTRTCDACENIAEAYFFEEIAKGMGNFAANEWMSTVRKNRNRESKLNSQSSLKRPKWTPRDWANSDSIRDQSFLQCERPSGKLSLSTCDTAKTTSLKRDAKDFSDLVLTSDTLSTPIEIFTLGGRLGEISKSNLFIENFGLIYTDAAHVVLREANPNFKT